MGKDQSKPREISWVEREIAEAGIPTEGVTSEEVERLRPFLGETIFPEGEPEGKPEGELVLDDSPGGLLIRKVKDPEKSQK